MSHAPCRLATGGRIDRKKPITFSWEGKTYSGYEGDTLASALIANGIRLVGRSFKYHRPRGILAAGVEESNALVQLGAGGRDTPNMRATEVRLYDGLTAKPVNCWPSARFDVSSVNNLVSRFLPAGFYYKTFMWPDWHLYEGIIRRAAGLGRVSSHADPDRYESRFAHCDVAVIGAGVAGLAAAREAARSGARVLLIEQDQAVGGNLLYDRRIIDGLEGGFWAEKAAREIADCPDADILLNTVAVGYHDHNSLTLVEQVGNEAECARDPRMPRYRTWLVRAKKVILATGAIERPLVFPGNDRPGVMLAGAVRHYAWRYAALPGEKTVLFTNNDDAYRTALTLHDLGATVVAVVDLRTEAPADLAGELDSRSIPLLPGSAIIQTRGSKSLKAVQVRTGQKSRWISCDTLAMSGGYNPTVHLFSQSGGQLRFDDRIASYVPDRSVQDEISVGAARGAFSTGECLAQGFEAGGASSEAIGFPRAAGTAPQSVDRAESPILACWHIAGAGGKAFVDFQNDVSTSDIALSAHESFRSVEHLKRYTTLGMASDQGKTSNVNALAIMASLTGRSVGESGHTRYRFPYTPIALGTLAGRYRGEIFRPLRRLPAHGWHEEAGALFEDFGGWARPACYPRAGEARHDAERREALAVRNGVGLFDGSPLGKIEVKGPDAARFLDLIYANTMSTLKVGKVRYGLMLNEQGVIIDDGVATRLADDHFLVGTSSGGADRIAAWMEEWLQCEWLDFDVIVAPVTTAWGVITVTGPQARALLAKTGTDIDLSALTHMGFAIGRVADIEARVFRVSYTGEASFEINVAARATEALWRILMNQGEEFGVAPVGIDAWDLLRTEKGYLHIGADTDGTTTALDVGWAHIMKKKNEFVGKRSLMRPQDQRTDRPNFVGLAAEDGRTRLPIGAHIVAEDASGTLRSEGYVTSSVFSPTLETPVALGMLRGGRERLGEKVRLRSGDAMFHAVVVDATFYDKEGARLNA
ncbi:sarcosine oxidase subunit alpha family protein [Sphingobium sp.]|uniref:sarcosine oxidase subunit alpha family protein n=1 Tax=Sphingobium sp. TaxID=1912891 RepID=UPI0028BF50BD|nr:sarcosine oxidase subunit alpha family protein [Sphingobium sp.]